MRAASLLALSIATTLAGCPGPATPPGDTGTDASGGSDAGHDAAVSIPDMGTDGGFVLDGGDLDVGQGMDGGLDAPAPSDAASACDAGRDGGGVEACDGVDDDCDFLIDEGCTCVPGTPVSLGVAGNPTSLAASAAGFAVGIVGFTPSSVSIQRASTTFAPVGTLITLASSDTLPPSDVDLALSGGEIGALYRQWPVGMAGTDHTWFVDVTQASGAMAHGPVDLGAEGLGFAIDPGTGSTFVTSRIATSGPGVRVLAADGSASVTGSATSSSGGAAYNAVAIGGAGVLGVAFQPAGSASDMRFQRFDATGAPLGAEILLDAGGVGAAQRPSIAGDAGGWLIGWVQNLGSMLRFEIAHVTASGTVDVAPMQLAMVSAPSQYQSVALASDGTFGVLYVEITFGHGVAHFVHLDTSGTRMEETQLLAFGLGTSLLAYDVAGARFVAAVGLAGSGPALYEPCVAP